MSALSVMDVFTTFGSVETLLSSKSCIVRLMLMDANFELGNRFYDKYVLITRNLLFCIRRSTTTCTFFNDLISSFSRKMIIVGAENPIKKARLPPTSDINRENGYSAVSRCVFLFESSSTSTEFIRIP